jgi:hypothetical protein
MIARDERFAGWLFSSGLKRCASGSRFGAWG